MVSPGTLTVPRRLIPALMLLATHGTPDPSALAELERSGVVAGGSLSSDVAGLLAVMTDPELVISVEVTTRDGSRLSTIWATAASAVWGRPGDRDVYQLCSVDTLTVPLLLAQLTGVGKRPEAPFSGTVTMPVDAHQAALDWRAEDPETALAILVAAGVDPLWADRVLIADEHRRALWTVSSVWTERHVGHEVHEARVLDAGPAGYWRLTAPDQATVAYTVISLHETMRLLRRCVPGGALTSSPDFC